MTEAVRKGVARHGAALGGQVSELRCPVCTVAPETGSLRCGECTAKVALDAEACPACGARQTCVRCECCSRWSFRLDWWAVTESHAELTRAWRTYRVALDESGDYPTIAEAVARVPVDSRVIIGSGTWRESVVVERRVEIIGDGEVVWEPASRGECLRIRAQAFVSGMQFRSTAEASDCVVVDVSDEAHIDECSFAVQSGTAIAVLEGALHVRSCDIGNARVGMRIQAGASLSARDVQIHDCEEVGIASRGVGSLERVSIRRAGQAGIVLGRSAAARLVECAVSECGRSGVSVVGDARPEFYGLDVSSCDTGIWAAHESCVVVRGARVHNAASGIVASDRAELTLYDCQIESCTVEGLSAQQHTAVSGARVHVSQRRGTALLASGEASLALTDLRLSTVRRASAAHFREQAAAVLVDVDMTLLGTRGVLVDDGASLTIERGAIRHPTAPLWHAPTARVRLDGCSLETLGTMSDSSSTAARFSGARDASAPKTAIAGEPNSGAAGGDEFDEALAHLRVHGSLSEAELIALVGARRARAFARRCDVLNGQLPFRVRIEVLPGSQKVYVKDGGK